MMEQRLGIELDDDAIAGAKTLGNLRTLLQREGDTGVLLEQLGATGISTLFRLALPQRRQLDRRRYRQGHRRSASQPRLNICIRGGPGVGRPVRFALPLSNS